MRGQGGLRVRGVMGYLHINNLYKDQRIFLFRECYALEKVHGTSAHIMWKAETGSLTFFSGGASHDLFTKLFDTAALSAGFAALGHAEVLVYGEAHGGSQQGMKSTYGDALRFIVFDVLIGESWLSVPDMEQVAIGLGLEVVPYRKVLADLGVLNAERDQPSEVAVRRGCGEKPREGVVLRPLVELHTNNGERVIAKHKGEAFEERKTPQKVVDSTKLAVLADANAIAEEWVTPMRLAHVLDKMSDAGIEQTRDVIVAMVEDVRREAKGEIVESREAMSAIGRRTAQLFKARLQSALK